MTGGRVGVHVDMLPVRWCCPTFSRELACLDHAELQLWSHLDTCQLKTFLHARGPRVECPDHGVLHIKAPWVENKGLLCLKQ